jgi:hypothetical protein
LITMQRIDQIRAKLAASLTEENKPKPGYSLRVAALRRELGALELHEAKRAATPTESGEVDNASAAP